MCLAVQHVLPVARTAACTGGYQEWHQSSIAKFLSQPGGSCHCSALLVGWWHNTVMLLTCCRADEGLRKACQADADLLCSGVKPGGGQIQACLVRRSAPLPGPLDECQHMPDQSYAICVEQSACVKDPVSAFLLVCDLISREFVQTEWNVAWWLCTLYEKL